MAARRAGFEAMIIVTFIMYLVTTGIIIVASMRLIDIVPTDLFSAHYAYALDVDVAAWFHLIWIPTALWQFIWFIYGLSTLCRKDLGTGAYLYYSPPFMPITMYAMYLVSGLCTIGLVFTLTYGYLSFAFGFVALITITLLTPAIWSIQGLNKHTVELARSGQAKEINLVIGLVQNGILMWASYMEILMLVYLGKVLVYIGGYSQEFVAVIVLSLMMVIAVLLDILEMIFWRKETQYLLTPSFTYLFGIISMVVPNVDFVTWDQTSYMLVGTLALICIFTFMKLIHACVQSRKYQSGNTNVFTTASVIIKH